MSQINRREWLKKSGVLATGMILSDSIFGVTNKKNPTILLVSGWQDVNIGDIAHTPGLLHIFETFLPETKIILWKKSDATEDVKYLLKKNFPDLKVIYGSVDAAKNVDNPEVIDAFKVADIMIHGSGPSVVGQTNLEAWVNYSAKPFCIFGTTIQTVDSKLKTLLQKAVFIFTRETASIESLKNAGIYGAHVQFAPDATFYFNLHNPEKARQFLKMKGLEEKKFICVIPRLRYTPYHKFRSNLSGWSDERIKLVEETNLKYKEADHAKLREAMIAWVRKTGQKVLVCPEMTYQVDIMDELLIDPLPSDVKPLVVKRGYWLPDEAASVYAMAHTVISFECHSPIIAAANGSPMFYLRQPEDTIKGQMYYDLGFNDWIFEIEQTSGIQIANRLLEVWNDYEKAKEKLALSMDKVNKIYHDRCNFIESVL